MNLLSGPALAQGETARSGDSPMVGIPRTDEPDPFPRVQGFCPSCGGESLFLASGGYITCSRLDCPNPTRVTDWLAFRRRIVGGDPEAVTRG